MPMTRRSSTVPTSGKSPLVGPAVLVMVGLALAMPATPAHGDSVSTTGTANVLVLDRIMFGAIGTAIIDNLMLAKLADIDLGGTDLRSGDHGTVELRPDGTLVADGNVLRNIDASFSAVFSLSGPPNKTYGINLPVPGSMALASGGTPQSVRTFMHDAGPTPTLGTGGRSRFNVGAVFSIGKTSATKTQVYNGAFYVIVSNN